MKFSVGRDDLLRPLQMAHAVVERRQTLPILANVHLNLVDGKLTLAATDLEVELAAEAPILTTDGSLETTMPARKLLDLCRASPEGGKLDFDVGAEKVVIRAGRARFTVAAMPAAEFPGIDIGTSQVTLEMPQQELRALLERVHFAMAQQDVRYYLNGMLFEVSGTGQRVVATDGHRMAIHSKGEVGDLADGCSVIVPRKAVIEIMRLLTDTQETATLSLGKDHLMVTMPGLRFKSKLIDGAFPEYQRVVPQGADKVLIADRHELREVLSRVAIFSNEKYRAVRFEADGQRLRIAANNTENEEAEEEMSVDYSGEPIEVGFNVNYVTDVLGVMAGDKVEIRLSDPNSSCLLKEPDADGGDGGALYVIMPMRL